MQPSCVTDAKLASPDAIVCKDSDAAAFYVQLQNDAVEAGLPGINFRILSPIQSKTLKQLARVLREKPSFSAEASEFLLFESVYYGVHDCPQ
ncbi:MAG: hypothetical protein WCG83_02080 [Candidatus Peregrinibacteria bacterium]